LVPDAPFDLTNSEADTNAFQVSFTWLEGLNNGGKPVDFYEISYDQGRDVFVVLEAYWTTGTSYTTNAGLVAQGLTYTFKIRSANSVGYSLDSTTLSIKAAQVPDRPDPAPTTQMVNSDIKISWLAPNNRG
jgi:hypothetical protein